MAYASRGLRGAEKNYSDFSSFKIELLALKWAVADKFREYLIGGKCKVLTDNNPLAHLQTAKLGATEQRWVAQLSPFDLEIVYRAGKMNKCADALSRCPANDENSSIDQATHVVLPVFATPQAADGGSIQGIPCIFPSYTHQQLREMQLADPVLSEVWELWGGKEARNTRELSTNAEVKGWLREFQKLVEFKGVLYRGVKDECSGELRQLLVPACLRTQILEMTHDQWAHQGVNRTFSILRTRCFWPGMSKDVKAYISNCLTCRATKSQTPQVRTPRRHLLAFRPQELVAIDFLKLDRGRGGYEDVLVITDAFTKYAQAVPCKNQTAPVVAKVLRDNWFAHYGTPLRIHSDQGRNFESQLIKELCVLYGVKKTRTTPYHPEGNGQTERFNRTLCSMIRSEDPASRKRWPELLSHIIFLYNSTPHSVTGVSPYRMLYGRDPYTPVDQLLCNTQEDWTEDFVEVQAKNLKRAHGIAERRMKAVLQKQKHRHDNKSLSKPIPIGKRVLLRKNAFTGRHKLEDKYNREPFIVVWVNEEGDVYNIRPVMGGPAQTVNRKQLIEDPREDLLPTVEEEPDNYLSDEATEDSEEDRNDSVDNPEEDDEVFLFPYWLFGYNRPPEELPQPPVRRSLRANKGVHSNPAHLPRPAIH